MFQVNIIRLSCTSCHPTLGVPGAPSEKEVFSASIKEGLTQCLQVGSTRDNDLTNTVITKLTLIR